MDDANQSNHCTSTRLSLAVFPVGLPAAAKNYSVTQAARGDPVLINALLKGLFVFSFDAAMILRGHT